MINIIETPVENSVVPDGNTTIIRVSTASLTGGGSLDPTYLEATITVDGQLFTTQLWSQDDSGQAAFDLKGMLRAAFTHTFESIGTAGFVEAPGLVKKVEITVKQYNLLTDVLIFTRVLPPFYVIKATHPTILTGNGLSNFEILDFPHEEVCVPRNARVRISMLVKAGAAVTAALKNATGEVIAGTTHNCAVDANRPRVVEIAYFLAPLNLALLTPHVRMELSVGGSSVKRVDFLLEWNKTFSSKLVFFENNYGTYCAAYLFGKLETGMKLSPQGYKQEDGSEKIYFVDEEEELRVNSGYGFAKLNQLLRQIAKSLDVLFLLDNQYVHFNVDTKTVTISEEGEHAFAQRLVFTRKSTPRQFNIYTSRSPVVESVTVDDAPGNTPVVVPTATFTASYDSAHPYEPTSIAFISTPVNGSLAYENAAAETVQLFENGVDTAVDSTPIALDDFVSLIYTPNANEWGEPIDEIEFKMGNVYFWSEASKVTVNIPEFPAENQPPVILTKSSVIVSIDGNGDGTLDISATITDPEDDAVSILWEALESAPITFDNTGIASPQITLDNATAGTTYKIKVTATDTDNSLSSEKEVSVLASLYMLVQAVSLNSSTATEQIFDYTITGGSPEGTLDLRAFIKQSFDGTQYALLRYGDADEILIAKGGLEQQIFEVELDVNGEASFQIALFDPQESGAFIISVEMQNPDPVTPIDEETSLIDIAFNTSE